MPSAPVVKFTPKRGRPSAKQVAAIERVILATARRMFLDDGYDAVAMEGVAMRAGVSKGTLYARHPSKESLFEAVVKSSVADWSDRWSGEDYLLTDNLAERLHHHARTIIRSGKDPDVAAFRRLLLSTAERFPALSRIMYENGYLHIVRLVENDIKVAAARDGIPVKDANGVARLMVSALTGVDLQERVSAGFSDEEVEALGSRCVDLLMASRTIW